MMRMVSLIFYVFLCAVSVLVTPSNGHTSGVKYLTAGIPFNKAVYTHSEPLFSIFCYRGTPKSILHIWQSTHISITLKPEDYTFYLGETVDEVQSLYDNHKSSWTSRLFSWKSKDIQLDPFSHNCIGIETSNDYAVTVNIIKIDIKKIIFLVAGILLFISARRLSSNPVFYYICGIVLGITTSVLIALYLISRLIPKKPAVYGFLIGGWTISAYFIQLLWHNMRTIALKYQSEVIAYMFVTGIISFIVCYRFGPVTDPKSRNLIKWFLQTAGLSAIFFSSHIHELSVLIMLQLLLYYNFPTSWSSALSVFWIKRFPPKRKLLTEDEYHEQGVRETGKALEQLRKYCSSPECKQWKTILALREPVRFAEFVEGRSHLVESEILEHESESGEPYHMYNDDSEDSDY